MIIYTGEELNNLVLQLPKAFPAHEQYAIPAMPAVTRSTFTETA